MYIHWEPAYEIGNLLIDTEHRLLMMLFRKLDIAIKTGESEASMVRILQEVKKFADFHFSSEENLMHDVGYPDTERHELLHSRLLAQLEIMIGRVSRKKEFPEDLLYFLNHWILEHIAREDKKLATYVEASIRRPVAELIYPEYLGLEGSDDEK